MQPKGGLGGVILFCSWGKDTPVIRAPRARVEGVEEGQRE